jgi:Phage integrase, N-terminal SAM-like domain
MIPGRTVDARPLLAAMRYVEMRRLNPAVFGKKGGLLPAGFLAGYTGLARDAYALDLRQYASWCQQRHRRLSQARRADIECFARELEARGRARATITRRPCTIAGFYRYAVEEELLDHSPAVHVRRPRLDYESHATDPWTTIRYDRAAAAWTGTPPTSLPPASRVPPVRTGCPDRPPPGRAASAKAEPAGCARSSGTSTRHPWPAQSMR